MRIVFRLALAGILTLSMISCISYNNLYQGITCFKAQEYRKAFIHLKPEAQKGQPEAQYAVGYMYYYGQGVVENRTKAWYWITKAASAGQPDAIAAASILKRQGLQ